MNLSIANIFYFFFFLCLKQVLYEITEGKLGVLEPPPTTPAGPSSDEVRQPKQKVREDPQQEEEEEEDLTEMQSRLQALRS